MTERMIKAAHALDGIPVIALRSDGSEEETTAAKAIGMGDLAKQARNDWREAVETIDKALASYGPRREMDNVTKQAAFDRLAAYDPWAKFGRMVKAYKAEAEREKAAKRLTGLIKAELTCLEIDKIKKKMLKIKRESAARQAHIAEMRSQLANAHAKQAEIAAQIETLTVDATTRIDAMMKRLDAGQAEVRISQERQAIADLARQDQIRADWTYKASVTTDPVLRQAYLNRSEGISDDD